MNQVALFALLGLPLAATDVVYNALDDPRCHEEPSRPVLEPTPGPSNFPPPPGEYRVYEEPDPEPLKCPGMVTGFQIVNPSDSSFTPVPLKDGMTIKLKDMPDVFTVQALVEESVTEVKFEVDGTQVHHDHTPAFEFTDGEFSKLYVEGTYTLSAYATDGTWEPKEDECSITVTVDYGNPENVCEGLVLGFALFDTTAQDVVPGYEVLADGQDLDLADLPDHLSIIAITSQRAGDEVSFYVNGEASPMTTTSDTPYAITGLASGEVPEWTVLRQTGDYTFSAKMKDRLGNWEPSECSITVHVDSDWICHNEIVGFSLIDATTDQVVPGYDHMTGARVIDLAKVPELLSLRVNKKDSTKKGVQIYLNTRYYRTENHPPYALNGDKSGDYHASNLLSEPGVYHFLTRGKASNGKWEPRGDGCELDLTVVDSSVPKVAPPPETTLRLIDNDDGPCAPKLVTPVTAGNHQYFATPVKVEAVKTDETVSFQVYNYIHESSMDWITTAFVTPSGVEVCDKVDNVAFEANTAQVYEAKCHEGFAYADVFAFSTVFSEEHISADTSMLPAACKNDFEGKVVRYTFVFSCNCEETPEVPDEITGGIPVEQMSCAGAVGNTWGDPHVVPFDGGQWDCQGTGEFVLAKATLNDYAYDFEAQARYWRFEKTDIKFSFNTGLVMKQDVTVQLTIAEKTYPYSTMFADLPVNFYVDGVPRLLTQGSGDHRVLVTIQGFNVMIYFVSTGIAATVHVRPNSVSGHIIEIPGSLTTYICIPDNNPDIVDVMGILGTPNQDLSDDWMDVDGTTIAQNTMNAFDYCTNTWCIRDEAKSLFTYDTGYDFDHYQRCDHPIKSRLLEETPVPSDEVVKICEQVNGNEACLYDGANGGVQAAEVAVEAIKELEKQRKYALTAKTQDDVACCSSDFKTCDSGCELIEAKCASCREGEAFRWLPEGPYIDPFNDDPEAANDLMDCHAKTETCMGSHECCPGLDCVDEACVPSESTARRLQEFVFARPDLPMDRDIIAYSDLLM